jgi:hypothetical protein
MWTAEIVLACALGLLGRSASSFPPIDIVSEAPADASPGVEAFVRPGSGRITVLATGAAFQVLQRSRDRCSDRMAARKLASVLVHEETHVRYGSDERRAYETQLTALTWMGAGLGTPPYQEVARAMRHTLSHQRRRKPELVTITASRP